MSKIDEIISTFTDSGILFDWTNVTRRKVVESFALNAPNDLYLLSYGYDRWTANRDKSDWDAPFTSVLFVAYGKGYVERNGRRSAVTKNHYFMLHPNERTVFWADKNEPWEYFYFDLAGVNASAAANASGIEDGVGKGDSGGRLFKAARELYDAAVSSGIYSFETTGRLYLLIDELKRNNPFVPVSDGGESDKYVLQAVNYVGNNYRSVKVGDVAAHCGVSVNYLNKLFRKKTGMKTIEFITLYRLRIVEDFLKFTRIPLKEIAAETGYSSDKYMIRAFKSVYDATPEQYRKRNQKEEKK